MKRILLILTGMIMIIISGCSLNKEIPDISSDHTGTVENKTEEGNPDDNKTENVIKFKTEDKTENVTDDFPKDKGDSETTDIKVINEAAQEDTDDKDMTEEFYMTEITDDIFERIKGKSFKDDCTLPREDLRYLHVLHKDIEGTVHEGEMIVNVHIAQDVLDILKELYENDYPIEKIRLVDEYDADDEASMEDNNSSSFNFRFVPRTKKISKHGRGLAVDINPLYNPYITKKDDGIRIEPVNAEAYADRDGHFDYKIEEGDLCYSLFKSHGFEWGGDWKSSKDYQHFEVPTSKIEEWY